MHKQKVCGNHIHILLTKNGSGPISMKIDMHNELDNIRTLAVKLVRKTIGFLPYR